MNVKSDFLLRLLLQATRAMSASRAFRHCHHASCRLFKQLNGCQDILLVCFHNSAIHQHLIHYKVGLHRHTSLSITIRLESLIHLNALLRIIPCVCEHWRRLSPHSRLEEFGHTCSRLNIRSSSHTLLKYLSSVSTRQWMNSRMASSFCKLHTLC